MIRRCSKGQSPPELFKEVFLFHFPLVLKKILIQPEFLAKSEVDSEYQIMEIWQENEEIKIIVF